MLVIHNSQIKLQLDNLERERARGVIIRYKAQWVEEGEKKHVLFFRLEKHNYCNKLITKLKVGDSVITDPIQILDEGHNFYRDLYSENAGHDLAWTGLVARRRGPENDSLCNLSDIQTPPIRHVRGIYCE